MSPVIQETLKTTVFQVGNPSLGVRSRLSLRSTEPRTMAATSSPAAPARRILGCSRLVHRPRYIIRSLFVGLSSCMFASLLLFGCTSLSPLFLPTYMNMHGKQQPQLLYSYNCSIPLHTLVYHLLIGTGYRTDIGKDINKGKGAGMWT